MGGDHHVADPRLQRFSAHEIGKMSEWIAKELGTDVPLHFTAFHPDYKMTDIPATPAAKLTEARQIAHSAGLLHVYTGNVHDLSGGTTHCPNCRQPLIVRDWHQINEYAVTENGECSHCNTKLAGHFGKFQGQFGRQRIPIRMQDDMIRRRPAQAQSLRPECESWWSDLDRDVRRRVGCGRHTHSSARRI